VIANWALALVGIPMLVAALFAAGSRNLVRAVLWLGLVLAMTAVLFVMLGASFLATVQVLLYIGGVVTLMIFGVMLTHRSGDVAIPRATRRRLPAAIASIALFAALALAITKAGPRLAPAVAQPPELASLATTLLGKDLLAFEALSLLLLAAMIGAIVLARPRDAGEPAR
jgi:NADH-quinone oxidoreductase subunit J